MLNISASLTATNAFNQTGGQIVVAQGATLTLAGTAQFGPYGTGDIDGPGTLSTSSTTTLDENVYIGAGLTWSNSGTVDNASNLIGGDTAGVVATFVNLAGASFDFLGDYESIENSTNTGNASQLTGNLTFINQGTLAKTGGSGTSVVSVTLDNAAGGTITSLSGTLALDGGGTINGAINGTGTVDFGAGVSTVSSALTATNAFNQSSGQIVVAQGATLTLAGTAQFGPYGTGDIDGPGTLSTTGTTTLDENVYIGAGLTWSNSGTVDNASNLIGGDTAGVAATFVNLAGASFDFVGDYENIENSTNTGNASQPTGNLNFINQGTLAKTGGSGTSVVSVTLDNAAGGTITSNSGTLALDGGGTINGAINGTGTVDFGAGVSTVSSALTATNAFNQTGGQIVVAQGATLTLAGTAQFGPYGTGEISGPGMLSTTGMTTLDENVYIGAGLTWRNSGTVDNASNVFGGDTAGGVATIVNLAGANFDFVGDYENIENSTNTGDATQSVGTLTFVNQGTLAKTGGGGTSVVSVTLDNAAGGTITSNNGTLALNGGGTINGAINGTGTVDFGAGVSTVTSALTATNTFNQTGGQIVVAQGATLMLAGTAQFGPYGTGDIDGPGTLSTTGTTTLDENVYIGAGLTWINSGTVDNANALIGGDDSGGTATFVNVAGASFDFVGDYLYVGNNTSTTGNASQPIGNLTFVNHGTLAKTGGGGTSTVYVTLDNAGLVKSGSGTLQLAGSVDNTGTIEGVLGGAVDIVGSLSGSGDLVIDRGGEIEVSGAFSEAVVFSGSGMLQLDTPSGFTGTIYGFTPGGVIALGGAGVTNLSMNGSLLHVTTTRGSYDLAIAGLLNTGQITRSGNTLTGGPTLLNPVPYLSISNVTTPAKAVAGQPLTLDWTDTNFGGVSATGPWTDQVYLASDAAGDNPQLLGSVTFAGTLTPGQSTTQTLSVTLPAATTGNQYFLIKADALNQVPNDAASTNRQAVSSAVGFISTVVATPPMSISQITPTSGSDLGNVTVTVDGANFDADDVVAVIGSGGQIFDATQIRYVNGGTLWATFDLTAVPLGAYHVQVSNGSSAVTSPGTFQVDNDPAGQLSVNLVLPQNVSAGSTATGTVTYTNTGATDVAAPILDVSSSQALLQGTGDTTASGEIQFLATDPGGPAGILTPDVGGSYSFTFTPTHPTVQGDVTISLGVAGSSSTISSPGSPGQTYSPLTSPADPTAVGSLTPVSSTIDWASLENSLRPATVDPTDWNNVFTVFVAHVGTTTDSLTAALDADATELSQVGQPTSDIVTLLQYELFLASGALAGTTLDTATDISPTSSSLSLLLGRSYDGSLLSRDATGAFGDGWTFTYEVTATVDPSGNVYVRAPGQLHVFTLQANGSYIAQSGDPASLTQLVGLYRMSDGAGDTLQFNAADKLASLTDPNGNATSLTYGGNRVLQSVSNSTTGETISFTSNAAGRITGATDSDGQTVSYSYDATNTLLLGVTESAGTTSYTYAPVTGSAQDNALTSVTNPDGTQQLFNYDAEGRLALQSAGSGTGLESYSYTSPGTVTVTDALGNQTTELYSSNGTVAQVQDALGNVTQLQSNAAGELTRAITADGNASSYAYDTSGNLTSYTDPLGGTVAASYAAGRPNLTSFTDQRGSQTHYTYDGSGNVTGITYQDGIGNTYAYNTAGLLTSSTSADGNTTQYAYNSAGELTGKTFADGTSDTYAYNAQGDLTAATASSVGTTNYTYDTANRLTGVTNPQGQLESYTYNALGQLASRTEPDGLVTQYSYDTYGRLAELQNGSGNLLDKYTYSKAGELIRTDTGNGAYTTRQYDADGNVTQVLNSNPDGSVATGDSYTYNANGLVVQDAGTNGVWTYGYDASGELTTATFASANPAIQNQSISYLYDAAGNRISQTINGVVMSYTTNALNQYTAVGGTTYTYDADGNTTSETDSSGTTTFSYGDSGKLVSQTGPGGSYQYSYDALGNLVSTTQNGTVSNYINDPLSLSLSGQNFTSIGQINSAAGIVQANYVYGLGLATTISAGMTLYYLSDSAGDVTGLTGSAGELESSSGYSPFGAVMQTGGTVGEPFQFVGALGIATSDNTLIEMRSRVYDAILGRFLSPDPSGLSGGTNLYEYGLNSPTNYQDLSGLKSQPVSQTTSAQPSFFSRVGQLFSPPPPVEITDQDIFDGTAGQKAQNANQAAQAYSKNAAYVAVTGVQTITPLTELREGLGIGQTVFREGITTENAVEFGDGIVKIISSVPELIEKALSAVEGKKEKGSDVRDPHVTTFDGLRYDFQTAGEFVLTRQTSGGSFEVQARISAPIGTTSYSVITELGIQVGADRVTIDSTRSNVVWVNGVEATFTDDVDNLAGGQITQTRSGYVVSLNTGESVTATIDSLGTQIGPGTTSAGIDTQIALNPFVETPGTIQGLLGNGNGNPSQDLTLADGTVLPTNMPTSELYGAFADSWRVTQATSLLDYGPGQTTATFTDTNYPGQAITLASFPQAQVQAAEALAAQAGITDPGLQQAAAFDYLVTGNAASFIVEANLQQQGSTTAATADFTTPTPGPMVGVIATAPTEAETSSGPTTADFQVYRSGDTSAALTVTYSVVAPDASFVGASALGGSLPSGTISFAAGQATADLPITLAQGIGAVASQMLEVQITAPSSTQVIGPTAQLQILNAAPVAGPTPSFAVELVDDQTAAPVVSGNTWTFNLAAATQGTASSTGTLELAVLNAASLGADSLSGTITATGDGGIPTTITQSFSNLAPSALTDIAALDLAAAIAATGTETLTIALTETNGTGFSASLPTETVIIQNSAAPTSLPAIAAPVSATVNVGQATAISGVCIAETGDTPGETYTLTLTDTNGLLSATGTGVQGSGSKAMTIAGSLAQVDADLATLQDTDTNSAADTITLNATDSLGNAAVQQQIAITVQNTTSPGQPGGTSTGTGNQAGNSTPVASGPASVQVGPGMSTIGGVSLSDPGYMSGETYTVTLTDSSGLLSATGTGLQGSGSKALTISGSLAQVNADLVTLQDTDASGAADTITLNATNSLGTTAPQQQIAITAQSTTSPSQPGGTTTGTGSQPGISTAVASAPTSVQVGPGTSTIAGVRLSDAGNTSGETYTVTLTDTNGLLSATGTGVQGSGSTALTIAGSLTQVNADLATLQDNDVNSAADTITLNATDSLGNTVAQQQIAITAQNTASLSQPGGSTTGTGSAPGDSTPAASAPVYRFFDTVYGTHLFTQSLSEAQSILATRPDLFEETNNFGAVNPQTDLNAEAVYRFFETSNGTHFFTANRQEFLGLTTPGSSTYRSDFTYEANSTFYEDSIQQAGDVAVYRLFDSVHGTQFLTGSLSEYTGLTTAGSSTYRPDLAPEGIAFYAPTGSFST